jgi:hypothetical protein
LPNPKSSTSPFIEDPHVHPESDAVPSGFLGVLDLTDDQVDVVMNADVDFIDLTVEDDVN